ncbi:unnamed protein product [Camellia sinensis]
MMSVSFSSSSDCFSDDLLCGEDSSEILSDDSPECYYLESPADIEESIAGFIEDERNYVPGIDYLERFQSQPLDASARARSVAWILKSSTYYTDATGSLLTRRILVCGGRLWWRPMTWLADRPIIIGNAYQSMRRLVQAYYGFQPLTAYLSVNYLDRFMYSRRLPQTNGWPLQLLSVACLSLAAKMEELLVPSLLDLQVEGAKYIFEPRTIRQMELLVLGVLDWKLRSITPFSFVSYFACKLDSTGTFSGLLKSRATQIILSYIQEASFLEYWPSCIAAAAILCAAHEIPNSALVNPAHAESWCEGLSKVKEKINSCYQLMQEAAVDNRRRKPPKVLPQLQVMTQATTGSSDSSSSSSTPSSYKRRKLNNSLWVEDDKGSSD